MHSAFTSQIANLSWGRWVRRTVVARPIHKPVVGVLELGIQRMVDINNVILSNQLFVGYRF